MAPLYHVEITPKAFQPPHRRVEHETDLSADELERRFIIPYSKAESVVIRGRLIPIDDLHRIRIYLTEQKLGTRAELPKRELVDVTNQFIAAAPGYALEEKPQTGKSQAPADPRVVFVVHGRNDEARNALFEFLRAIGLHPLEWSEAIGATGSASPYIGEILDAAFDVAQAVVVLLTPDDDARLKQQFWNKGDAPYETVAGSQPRPNVLFEAGMAMGRDAPRTVLVELGRLRPFSDMAGRHTIKLDDSTQKRQDLAQRLKRAGCSVKLEGTDWHSAGKFEAALAPSFESDVQEKAEIREPTYGGTVAISGDAANLLIEAMNSKLHVIQRQTLPNGTVIKTNGKSFGGLEDLRSGPTWELALKELVDFGLVVEDDASKGEVFGVTTTGFNLVDSFEFSQHLIEEESRGSVAE